MKQFFLLFIILLTGCSGFTIRHHALAAYHPLPKLNAPAGWQRISDAGYEFAVPSDLLVFDSGIPTDVIKVARAESGSPFVIIASTDTNDFFLQEAAFSSIEIDQNYGYVLESAEKRSFGGEDDGMMLGYLGPRRPDEYMVEFIAFRNGRTYYLSCNYLIEYQESEDRCLGIAKSYRIIDGD